MCYEITNHKFGIALIGITLLLIAFNLWLAAEFPFYIGNCGESPVGIYQFQLVDYEITDYGSEGSINVMEEHGNFYDGLLIALGKDYVYRIGHYEYPFERDTAGVMVFFSYMALLVINAIFLVLSLVVIFKKIVNRK